ncbi:NUAK family SNF1-like kinase 1 [Watersipora subatra]|uniref:NUAK family SNF1-like kinase 1 n=1 Tax=Watersipora subatra TaxID=2589382 RepID=UPI00355C780E
MHDNTITMSEVFNQPSKHRHNLKHRFEIIKSLGSGTYGKVKLAIDKKTGQKVAIKSIAKRKVANDENLTRIRREIEIMASLKHRHIVQILEVFENKDKIILVQEFADGGELYDYISSKGKLTEKEARLLFRQIVSAVHYLHENGVVHRDLKLENILLDRHGMIKLADFGLSNTWQHNKLLKTYCGSPLYASPEIVNGRPYYGPEVDCWSLGVLLYTLVYGAMPFDGTDLYKLREQISTGDYFKRPSKQSDASGLIARLLTVNPARRANIIDAAAHWWTNYEQKDLLALLELSEVSEKRTSDYFDDEDHEPVTVAFDSSKKPKKSILKNKKISGGDSGCGLSDAREGEISLSELSSPLDDIASPKTQSVKTVLLKADKKTEKSKRQSISSNSSADTLDFSYDSSSSGASDPLVVFEDSLKNRTTRLNQSRFHQALASPITSSVVYSCSV